MKRIKSAIPNTLTCLNLLTGCIAVVFIFNNRYYCAGFFVGIAAVFDFFDGLAARALKVGSPLGKQLDSLADLVSFGLVPGLVLFQLISITLNDYNIPIYERSFWHIVLALSAMLIPVFSAIRLGKFNLDERQSENFIGLPTPANAILITSIPLILHYDFGFHFVQQIKTFGFLNTVFHNAIPLNYWYPAILVLLSIFLSLLLISELPLFSLKFKNFTFKDNKIRFIFLGLSAICYLVFAVFFHYFYFPVLIIIILYVILSLINNLTFQTQDQ